MVLTGPKSRSTPTVRKMTFAVRSHGARSARNTERHRAGLPRRFLSLAKTCDKPGIAIWDYLGSRFEVVGHLIIAPLDHYVRARLRPG